MPQLSHGTMFVWSAAETETRRAEAVQIEPVHFLLGLTKIAELPEQAQVDSDDEANDIIMEIMTEAAAVRGACSSCGLDTTRLRRTLRDALPDSIAIEYSTDGLHRSDPARAVFKKASRLASDANSKLQPVHLLAAIVRLDDAPWCTVFDELDVDRDASQEAVCHAADPSAREPAHDDRNAKKSILGKYRRDLTALARDGKLEPIIGRSGELHSELKRSIRGQHLEGTLITAGLGLVIANFVPLEAIATMGSAGFLLVFMAVNIANVRLSRDTGGGAWISMLAAISTAVALVVLCVQVAENPATSHHLWILLGMIVSSFGIEIVYRRLTGREIRLVHKAQSDSNESTQE
jgi:hypothetical protein